MTMPLLARTHLNVSGESGFALAYQCFLVAGFLPPLERMGFIVVLHTLTDVINHLLGTCGCFDLVRRYLQTDLQ